MAKTIIGRNLPLYKGEYSSATVYDRFDVVLYDGSSYVSKLPNNQNKPVTNTTYWQLLAQRGEFTEQQLEDFKAEVVAESKEEMDDYTDDKKDELNTYTNTKETELNAYATVLKNTFDTNASTKTSDFNDNATAKTTAFNTNASDKTDTFDTNASTKTTAFDNNATSKTTAFNTNATNKTTDFNDNATAKTTAFDTNATNKTNAFDDNASDKTDDFNDNATAKTTEFDGHVEEKTEEFDENAESLQQEIDELSENMPWNTTEQATEISVDDAAKYSKNKLELFGNTSQESTTGVQLLDMSDTVNGYFTGNEGNSNTSTSGFHTQQYINVGNNTHIYGRFEALDNIRIGRFYIQEYDENMQSLSRMTIGIYDTTFTKGQIRKWDKTLLEGTKYIRLSGYVLQKLEGGEYVLQAPIKNNWNSLVKTTISYTDVDIYEPYTGGQPSPSPDYPQDIHVVIGNNTISIGSTDYPINLGSLELCKIGEYQDYLYKENGNWYKHAPTNEYIFTGQEDIYIPGTPVGEGYKAYRITVPFQYIDDYSLAYCTHFKVYVNANEWLSAKSKEGIVLVRQNEVYCAYVRIKEEKASNVGELKSYLANNIIKLKYISAITTITQITDTTLIAQLDAIYEHLKLVKGTNNITVTAEDLAPNMQLTYMQDLPTRLNNLASRIELLEE